MIKNWVLLSIFCSFTLTSFSQVSDNFNDGDFTSNPAWSGNAADWVVNAAFQLQSNNTAANSTYYLSTPNTLAVNTQWEMFVSLTFNPSSANYVDIFLTASQSDISNSNTTGYFVRVGNTDDEVSLYRKDAGGVITKIIDGMNGILNTSANVLKIKVIRAAGNQFTLFSDVTGTGTNYISEGSVADAVFVSSSYFGILVKQSTASFFQRHYFDDIEVKPFVPDIVPPGIVSVTPTSFNTLDILFSEPVDPLTSQTVNNYLVNNGSGTPVQAVRDASNSALVHLTFAMGFTSGLTQTITINAVKDLSGNTLNNGVANFLFYIPRRYDVVIDEILADPTPVIALPNAEFIELRNTSNQGINLQGWKLSNSTATSGLFPSYVLPPDSIVVVTSTANAPLFSSYGRVLGVPSFPSLDNSGAVLSLVSKDNTTIHTVSYDISWYRNAVKSDGGWTLEMMDTKNPCSGSSNWKASTDPRGGTPSAKNSADAINKDQTAPALLKAAATDSITIILYFDEPLDSLSAATTTDYSISDGINAPASVITLSPAFNQTQLRLSRPLVKNKVYTITVTNITDCSGNVIQALRKARVGLAVLPDTSDIILNEILFNPKANGVDYVEIYNRTNKIFDLKEVYIANRSLTSGAIGGVKQITAENTPFFPGDYYVISENGALVRQQYIAKNAASFADVSAMPSFPDDKGIVVIINAQGRVTDELQYDEKWHFALLDNKEGVSLERIDYNKPTQNKDNWLSAASTAGYGTPSYQNSQFRADLQLQAEISISPKIFSPDNDGFDDFAIISYKVSNPGSVANITIFDAAGRLIKTLVNNATLASNGFWRWDGLDDKFRKVPVGTYIVYTEVFNLNGKKKAFKNTVVVGARF